MLVHPPRAEGAALEADGVTRASLSGRARPLAGSPSVSTVPGTRTPNARCLGPAPLPIGLGRLESDRRDSNSPCELGKLACLPLTLRSHGADDGIEPAPSTMGASCVSRCATSVWSLPGESNPDRLRTGEACLPLPPSRRESDCRFLVCSAGVEPATDGSSSRPLYLSWSTSTWSRHPVPTRAVRCTKAEPQPCAAASLPTVDSNHDQHNQTVPSCRLDEWALSGH